MGSERRDQNLATLLTLMEQALRIADDHDMPLVAIHLDEALAAARQAARP